MYKQIEGHTSDWEFVATKSVLDSDGYQDDYTMYVNPEHTKWIFMFGDNDVYGPDEDYADWEAYSEEEAWNWFDSYNGFEDDDEYMDIEASRDYGGAFDIDPRAYFTSEDIYEFADNVLDYIYEQYNVTLNLADAYTDFDEKDREMIHMAAENDDVFGDGWITIDMRKIHSPRDLQKYVPEMAYQIMEASGLDA